MDDFGSSFDDFSMEMSDYELKKVEHFDRIWKVSYGGSISSTPLFYNNTIYFGCANHFVYALNPEDGSLKWKFEARDGIVLSYVREYNGLLYFGSFDHHMYAITPDTGKLVWKYETRDKIASTPCFSEGLVYFGGKDRFVYALKADTGELVWKYETFGTIISYPVVSDDKVLIVSYDRFLHCLNKYTGELVWKFETQGEIHCPSQLAVKDGIIYFNSFDNYVRAVDIKTGKLVWKTITGRYGCEGTATVYNDMIFNTARDGGLYTLDMNGRLIWKFMTREVPGEPCVHDGKLYIGGGDFSMYCLSLEGKELWRFKTRGYVWHQNIKVGNNIIFGSWDCNLYCVDADTGELVWKFNTGGSPCVVPKTYEGYEIQVNIPESSAEEIDTKKYDLKFALEEDTPDFYKSRITYQVSTQYASKGKYQVDSDEEAL